MGSAEEDDIEDIINSILDLKELFALSMQPKKRDAIEDTENLAHSDENVYDQWLDYLEKNPLGINPMILYTIQNFSKLLADELEANDQRQAFSLAIARLIKASLKEGTFVVPKDKSSRTTMEKFLSDNPDMREFLHNELGSRNFHSFQTANESLKHYIASHNIKILPKMQERSLQQKQEAQAALSKARANLIAELKKQGKQDTSLFFKDLESDFSKISDQKTRQEMTILAEVLQGKKDIIEKLKEKGRSQTFTLLVIKDGKLNIGETYKKIVEHNKNPDIAAIDKIPQEISNRLFASYLKNLVSTDSAKKYSTFLPTWGQKINQNVNREQQLGLLGALEARLNTYQDTPVTDETTKKSYIDNLRVMLGALNFLAWDLSKETRGFFSSQSRLEQILLEKRSEIKNILDVLEPTTTEQECNTQFYNARSRSLDKGGYPPIKPLTAWQIETNTSPDKSWKVLEGRNPKFKQEKSEDKKRLS